MLHFLPIAAAIGRKTRLAAHPDPHYMISRRVMQSILNPSGRQQFATNYLFFSLPFGITTVIGGAGRSEVEPFGSDVSFFGFFVIFSLRWSPLAINPP